jgi:hypothetical protein
MKVSREASHGETEGEVTNRWAVRGVMSSVSECQVQVLLHANVLLAEGGSLYPWPVVKEKECNE